MKEVVALQHLVAEFREGDALLGVQTTRDRVLGQHGAKSEVLADVAQEVDDGHLRGPVVIGDETHRIVAVGFQNAADLPLEPFGPAGDDVLGLRVRSPDWRGSPIKPVAPPTKAIG